MRRLELVKVEPRSYRDGHTDAHTHAHRHGIINPELFSTDRGLYAVKLFFAVPQLQFP